VIGSITCVLGAIVARRLAGNAAGVAAAVGLALYPNLVFHTGALLGETLYDGLFLAFLAVAVTGRWWHRPAREPARADAGAEAQSGAQAGADGAPVVAADGAAAQRSASEPDQAQAASGPSRFGLTGRALASGVLLGLAIMVRPISLAVVPVVLVCWWLAGRDLRTVARWSAALLVGVAACILPWTVRNAVRMHAFVPISTNTGDNLCIGHADGATGAFVALDACRTRYRYLDGLPAELGSDKAKTRIALKAIRQHPGREPWLTWRRFYFMWVRDGDHDGVIAVQSYRQDRWIAPEDEASLMRVADYAYWAVCLGGVVGLGALIWRRRPDGLLLVGSAVMTAAVPLAFFGDSRFKVPVIPLLIVAAACLLASPERPTEAVATVGPNDPREA
jgi:4-amino-4-deoxy-L-arabinose transferase-like glycosyltransferase